MHDVNEKKFIFRGIILVLTFGIVLYDMEAFKKLVNYDFIYFRLYHVIWFFMFLGMLEVFIPTLNNYVACGKIFKKHYKESPSGYNDGLVKEYTKKYNYGAIRAAIFWTGLLIVIGILYYSNIISQLGIHLIVVFFYFSDQFCINVWCPFRSWIVRNKCCNACRIYNWGHFMIFSPYIFIPSFWTYSLFLMSLIILIQWEYMHFKYPKRFCKISNVNLQCINCLKGECNYTSKLSSSLDSNETTKA